MDVTLLGHNGDVFVRDVPEQVHRWAIVVIPPRVPAYRPGEALVVGPVRQFIRETPTRFVECL